MTIKTSVAILLPMLHTLCGCIPQQRPLSLYDLHAQQQRIFAQQQMYYHVEAVNMQRRTHAADFYGYLLSRRR